MDKYNVESMTKKAAKQICSWRYEPPYNVYDYLSYEAALNEQAAITKTENADNYLCFWNDVTLVAYTSIISKDEKIYIGISVAPQFCGQGLGKIYLNQTVIESQRRYPDKEIWVQVRSWNKRAIKCYDRCSFKEIYSKTAKDRFCNAEEFVFMRLEKK